MDSKRPKVPHRIRSLVLLVARRPGVAAADLPSTLARSQPLFHLQVTTVTKTPRNHHENGTMEAEPPKQRLNLESLPPELLHRVCFFLCGHCFDPLQFCGYGSWDHMPLDSLCKTSRLLSTIAQPYVYHVIGDEVPRPLALLRTILENDKLASHIRAFRQFDDSFEKCQISCDDVRIAETMGINVRQDLDIVPGSNGRSRTYSRHDYMNSFIDMVLGSAPNLEYLVTFTQSEDSVGITDYRYLAGRLLTCARTRPLGNLRYLALVNDTYGRGLGYSPTMRALFPAAAASLEQFRLISRPELHGINPRVDLPEFPNLKFLEVQCHLAQDWNGNAETENNLVSILLRKSPRLRDLRFLWWAHSGSSVQPITAQQIVDDIRNKKELQSLVVDLSHIRDEVLTVAQPFLALKDSFPNLEYICLEDVSFCHHLGDATMVSTADTEFPKYDCLTSLLPPSIRKVTIRIYDDSPVWGDIEELARWAALDHLTELRTIEILVSSTDEAQYSADKKKAKVCLRRVKALLKSTPVNMTMVHTNYRDPTWDDSMHPFDWLDM